MKRLLLIAFGVLSIAGTASAQQIYHVVDSVFFHSNAAWNLDRPMFRTFGFSTGYTDSIDYRLMSQNREREIPAFPPSTFFVLFDAQNTTAWIDKDVRGVPDSIQDRSATQFSRRYVFDIQRERGQTVTMVLTRAFPLGIDSINFRDVIGGTGGLLFNKTLIAGSDSVTIPNDALTKIAMIVYFDAGDVPSSVREYSDADHRASLRLIPNPATSEFAVAAPMRAGARIVVSDIRGVVIAERKLTEAADRTSMSLGEFANGVYFVRALDDDGSLLSASRLVVHR